MRKLTAFLCILCLMLPAAASAATIVTSFYPVWLLALNLTQNIPDVSVKNLAAPDTGCLHDYMLMPSDMTALSEAKALLINGAGMEAFLPMVLEACPGLPVIDASDGIPLLEEDEEDEHEDHHQEESSETDDGPTHSGHHHEEGNSHIWLDPQRASLMAENLAAGLIAVLPEYADTVRANLNSLTRRFSALDTAMKSAFSGFSGHSVVIMHDAFPYFAEACRLNVIETVDKEPEDNLPASGLVRLIRAVSVRRPIPVIIRSTEEDPAVSVLSAETGAPECALKTLASGPDDPPLDYYETVMLENVQILVSVFQGT